ncbi:hypothetical protein P879_06351 [Paragonimus westermani]|uniref:Uncharacterized protein n=1 Tax=Paragonimus westermani TaxID=34504 RepID=A0A8T0DR15_9TREM|nr:hypothetical protein P879_06351 [Paragonimus westermani]
MDYNITPEVVIFTKSDQDSGNLTTSKLLSSIFLNFLNLAAPTIVSLNQPDIPELIDQVNSSQKKKIVVIVHLRRCAEVLSKLDATIPVLAVCGGTDLNEDVYNVDYLKVMTESVQRSRAVIVFTQSMLTRFEEFWPDYKGLLKMIPQAVNVNRELAYRDLETHVDWLTKRLGVELTRYFVIVGRLRPVKDPQFALQPFIGEHIIFNPHVLCFLITTPNMK